MSQDLKEAVGSFQQPYEGETTIILIFHVRKVRLRGGQLLSHSHTAAEGQSPFQPLQTGCDSAPPLSPSDPRGAPSLGVSWAASPLSPGLGRCSSCQEGAEDPASFPLGFLSRHPPNFLTSREERCWRAQLEFISIRILEPHFQQIIKLLFNYKQNMCAFP